MQNLVCTIDQPGVGTYPVSITRIDFDKRKELNGYIYLATSTFERLHNVNHTLTVQIQDRAGRYSKPVEFHLSLNDLYQQDPPSPGIFQDHDLQCQSSLSVQKEVLFITDTILVAAPLESGHGQDLGNLDNGGDLYVFIDPVYTTCPGTGAGRRHIEMFGKTGIQPPRSSDELNFST